MPSIDRPQSHNHRVNISPPEVKHSSKSGRVVRINYLSKIITHSSSQTPTFKRQLKDKNISHVTITPKLSFDRPALPPPLSTDKIIDNVVDKFIEDKVSLLKASPNPVKDKKALLASLSASVQNKDSDEFLELHKLLKSNAKKSGLPELEKDPKKVFQAIRRSFLRFMEKFKTLHTTILRFSIDVIILANKGKHIPSPTYKTPNSGRHLRERNIAHLTTPPKLTPLKPQRAISPAPAPESLKRAKKHSRSGDLTKLLKRKTAEKNATTQTCHAKKPKKRKSGKSRASHSSKELTAAEKLAKRRKAKNRRENPVSPPPLRPEGLATLKEALQASPPKSKEDLRQEMIKSLSQYYANTLLAEAKKETNPRSKILILISTLQQLSTEPTTADLDAIRAVAQRDINEDTARAVNESGQSQIKDHPLDVFGQLTGVKIYRQMATLSRVDTSSIDQFLKEVLVQQNLLIREELSAQASILTHQSSPEKEWESLRATLEKNLRTDMQSNADTAKSKASSKEKEEAIQQKMEEKLETRLNESKEIFMSDFTQHSKPNHPS